MANESEPATAERQGPPAAAPQHSPTATGFVAKARDLDALRSTVVDAAGIGAGLWFSYLFVFLYLLIAVGSVTHRDLLYASPIKLPFLAVELPLVGFFVLGPLLFLIVHAYVLLHLVLLASKVGAFHAELEAQIGDEDTRTRLRRQLPSNIFVQYLAGPREVRAGIIGTMLRLIAQISLVAGPLGLLLFFLLQFLPYHHEGVTWWHRFAVLADLALLWMLWPSIARGKAAWIAWRDLRTRKVAALALASLVPLLLAFTIATFPFEWLDARLPSVKFIPRYWPSAELALQEAYRDPGVQGATGKAEAPSFAALIRTMGWTSLHELLLGGDVDRIMRKPTSLWSNVLVLPEIDLVDRARFDTEEKIKAAPQTFVLRGRRLEGAVLFGARLRNVDLVGAQLQRAFLLGADLRDSKLCLTSGGGCANLEGAELNEAKLQGLDFGSLEHGMYSLRVPLRGANLGGAQLQGANLAKADLQDVHFRGAQLQGANLTLAGLQGAVLVGAQLQGANLAQASLQGADLSDSEEGDTPLAGLQGAQLGGALLVGAKLKGTRLQGADLTGALLQGADLTGAGLEGTNLTRARLEGANLTDARMRGALLDRVWVWRADPRMMNAESARILNPNRDQQSSALRLGVLRWLKEDQIPAGERRDAALTRIEILDAAHSDEKGDAAISAEWDRLAKQSPPASEYEPIVAEILQGIGCDATWGAYAINGWRPQSDRRFSSNSSHAAKLVDVLLDEAQCPAARELPERYKDQLKRDRAAARSFSQMPASK